MLDHEDYVVFKKIIFCHSGFEIMCKFKENAPNDPKYKTNANKSCIKEFEV